jgi:threonylcarbamoyladenosine tRNA methylthiotransferase MtaB
VLTGVDLTSFADGDKTLGDLVAAILARVPTLPRLRLSSLDSVEIDPLLEEIITGEPRLMPHLHLSLQAGDDMILKRMKRRHSRAQAIALVRRLKANRPELAIGADIIAGFPTETDEMFRNSLALVEDADIVFGHIFPYSPRHGTPAARMPQVAASVAKDRAARLRAAVAMRKSAWLDGLVGTVQNVLVELDGVSGHAGNFANVVVEVPVEPKQILPTLITASDGARLTGSPI